MENKKITENNLMRLHNYKKATINFVISVRPSVRPSAGMEQLGSNWTDFN
jgi:hypothetical protein